MSQSSPTDDQDRSRRLIDRPASDSLRLGNREFFLGLHDVDEMMRHASLIIRARLCGPDIHAAIDLHRIHGDDLSPVFLCQTQRHFAFAGGGRAEQCENGQAGSPIKK